MKKKNKDLDLLIIAVIGFCIVAGATLTAIFKVADIKGTSRAEGSFNCCPDVASERYVTFAGYKGTEEKGTQLICLYDVKTGINDTIYEAPEEYYMILDPILNGDVVEFKADTLDGDLWFAYRISTGELTCRELGDDYTYGYDVWRSLSAVVETPEYGEVTLNTEHGDYRYICTVGDRSFEIDAINSSMNWQASIYSRDCVYEDGKIYAKVLYHDDPFAKREGYFADHNQADRAALDEHIVVIDLKQQTSERLFEASRSSKRIIGYRRGEVYYFKGSSLYALDLDSGEKREIYTAQGPDKFAFAWCRNDLVILRKNSDYYGTYEVKKVIHISD